MSNLEAELNLLLHLVVMGVDIQKEGNLITGFLFKCIEITYQKIDEGKVSPILLDLYPTFEGEKMPAYMENFTMVVNIEKGNKLKLIVGIYGWIQNL